jgi:hypothetical protein
MPFVAASPARSGLSRPGIANTAAVALMMAAGVTGCLASVVLAPDGWWALSWIGYSIVGGLILLKRPRNAIGAVLMAIGLSWSVVFAFFAWIEGRAITPWAVWVEMTSSLFSYTAWALLVMVPVLFPHGRPPDRLTRALRGALIVVWVGVIAAELVSPEPKEFTGLVSPLAVPGLAGAARFIIEDGFVIVPLLLLISLVSLVVRWRRAAGMERLQYRWFVSGLGFVALALLGGQVVPDSTFGAVGVVLSLAVNLVPIAIGIAVLRYRLYEIDRIVSRTVAYALVIGILALIYAAVAVWLPSRVIGPQPDLFVAGATLIAAALFSPVRRRVLSWVDHRFYRSRYDAERVVAQFSAEVRNQVDVDRLASEWMAVVAKAMQPASAGVWVRGQD